jgi:hypothetical protein
LCDRIDPRRSIGQRVGGGVGSDLRMHGQIQGSPIDQDGSGFVRVREALRTLALNKWLTVEQTVGALRIGLGERARPNQQAARPTR